MNKMNIIHHTNIVGGGTLSCFDLINTLRTNGFNITLFSVDGESYLKKRSLKEEVNFVGVKFRFLLLPIYNGGPSIFTSICKFFIGLFSLFKWCKLIKGISGENVILNSIVLTPLIPLLRYFKCNTIVCVRETKREKSFFFNFFIKFLLEKSHKVTFLSLYDKNAWNLRNVVVDVIPDKINSTYFNSPYSESSSNSNHLVFLYTGGLNSLKGANVLIDAVNQISTEVPFIVYMCGNVLDLLSLRKKFTHLKTYLFQKKYFSKLKDSPYIKFIGSQSDMTKIYRQSDVVIIPYTKEHQSRCIYEAGFFKKPIIISDFDCYNESFINNYNGLSFKSSDSESLANRMVQFLEEFSEKDIIKMGNNNHIMANDVHNESVIDAKFLKVCNFD